MADQYYQLKERSGPNPGMTFPLEQEEVSFGRDLSNDISISDPEVSRRHARFFMREASFFVEDLGSTNGTFLNGERISVPMQLRVGDVITFGESLVMVFEKASEEIETKAAVAQEAQTVETPEGVPSSQYQPEQEPSIYEPPPEPPASTPIPPVEPYRTAEEKKGGLPTWLIILIIAIVVLACVIAVTLYFMPASWWCAITFDMLEGCPIP